MVLKIVNANNISVSNVDMYHQNQGFEYFKNILFATHCTF
jgi:hypothetical protein